MIHVDLTSGIGGFALAARWVGWTTVGFCEIDPFCQRVLSARFPGVPIHDDLKTLSADDVRRWIGGPIHKSGEPWILTAGYPCQPFSTSGNRSGDADPRHLWPWIRRLIADIGSQRPRWVCLENVVGHVSLGLDGVLSDLEDAGYACWTAIIPAAGVGALHRRDRVWVVGVRSDVADATSGGPERICKGDLYSRMGFASSGAGCTRATTNGAVDYSREIARHAWRPNESQVRGAFDGLSRSLDGPLGAFSSGLEFAVPVTDAHAHERIKRLQALGNAIVPQVAYVIFSAIAESDCSLSQEEG